MAKHKLVGKLTVTLVVGSPTVVLAVTAPHPAKSAVNTTRSSNARPFREKLRTVPSATPSRLVAANAVAPVGKIGEVLPTSLAVPRTPFQASATNSYADGYVIQVPTHLFIQTVVGTTQGKADVNGRSKSNTIVSSS